MEFIKWEDFRDIWRLRSLGEEVTLWPHIDEQLSGSKWEQIEALDEISLQVTKSHRPRSTLLGENTSIADIEGNVLKRTGSGSSSNVLIPPAAVDGHKKNVRYPKTNEDLKRLLRTSEGYSWIVQELAPHLLRLGEWRVVFCGGRISYIVHTLPTSNPEVWDTNNRVDFLYQGPLFSLTEIKYVSSVFSVYFRTHIFRNIMDSNPDWHSDDITDRIWGGLDSKSNKELEDFAQKTYDALLERDRNKYGHEFLAIQLWCRIDVGIIDVPGEDRLDFFVNEVEKFQSTHLFGKVDGNHLHPIETLADECALVMTKFMEEKYVIH